MMKHLRILFRYRDLLWMWTLREIKIRYKQSVLGGAWAVLQPLSLTVIFSVVFSHFVDMPSDAIPYPIFSYAAMLPWTFFATSINFGAPSLVTNLNLVTKIYFPREILPVASVGAAFFDFLVASTVFLGMLFFYRISVTWTLLWIPVLLIVQISLTVGVVLIAAAVNVFFRDVRFIVPLATQLWLYASPVIYPVSRVPRSFQPFYMLNPMAGLIDSYRRVILLGQSPAASYLAVAAGIAAATLLLGYFLFKRLEWRFADVI